MAEAIAALGIIASIAQLADYGFKLSIKLYSYNEAVLTADKSIKAISNDVSLTSTVLKELCRIIESEDAHVVSENAMLATKQPVDECLKIFADLNDALSKSLGGTSKSDKVDVRKKANRGAAALERLKWPFKQLKMELLRSNLDRLKASLTLMLQGLSYARDASSRKSYKSSPEYHKQMIESLARSECEMKQRYLALQRPLGPSASDPGGFVAVATMEVGPKDIDDGLPKYQPKSPSPPDPIAKKSVGKLLLGFQLINDILAHHVATKEDGAPSLPYDVLQHALKLLQVVQIDHLKMQFNNHTRQKRLDAFDSIQARLIEIRYSIYLDRSHGMARPMYSPAGSPPARSVQFASPNYPLAALGSSRSSTLDTIRPTDEVGQVEFNAGSASKNIPLTPRAGALSGNTPEITPSIGEAGNVAFSGGTASGESTSLIPYPVVLTY